MGYYTHFNLDWELVEDNRLGLCNHKEKNGHNYCPVCGKENKKLSLDDYIANYMIEYNFSGLDYAIGKDGECCGEVKWYDWKEDMAKMSADIPGVLFTLTGQGENGMNDIWRAYFFNGLYQHEKAQIAFSEFDKDKLKNV